MVPVLSSSRVAQSPAASTARPLIARTLRRTNRSIPAMPMAERSAPIVVGIRHTNNATRMTTGCSAFLNIANGWSVTVASRKMIVRPARRMLSAISLGVFCRDEPSTRAIIRSMNVSPGRAVMRTTISSDSTRVPPVTAERSPPDSRITGADSPVIADSSTLAMPSITSPSLGIISPATTTTSSSRSSAVLAVSSVVPSGRRRWATVSERVLRSVSACALPRPSAIASAKFANSTVNQRNNATRPVNTFSFVVDELRSLKNRMVVSTEPTPTTNMTGLRMSVRGLSLTKLSPIARRTISGSTSLVSLAISALRSQAELLDDGAEREDG